MISEHTALLDPPNTNAWRVYQDWQGVSGENYYIGPAENGSLDQAIATGLSRDNAILIITQQQVIERLTKEREVAALEAFVKGE